MLLLCGDRLLSSGSSDKLLFLPSDRLQPNTVSKYNRTIPGQELLQYDMKCLDIVFSLNIHQSKICCLEENSPNID